VQPVGVASLAPHPEALVLQVEIVDVGGQDLLRPCCCLIQQPPEALFPDADVGSAEEPLQ